MKANTSMVEGLRITIDGNEAAASVAHRLSEVIAIYPITPSYALYQQLAAIKAPGPAAKPQPEPVKA
jgi:pyruvate-ferredoxin/flavodoxin oxidoreductase